jgi:toxin CcdB
VVMKRFDVFRNANPRSAKTVPYLVLVQSELLDDLPTRVVVPLVRAQALEGKPASRLNPSFEIEGEDLFLLTQQLGAVSAKSLSVRVSSLEGSRDAVVQALDFLFSGI